MSIRRLDSTSVSKICINQVVVDMPMCIKELVENSLDAGATKIGKNLGYILPDKNFPYLDVTFYEYGSAGIRVTDNGSGINVENFDAFSKACNINY